MFKKLCMMIALCIMLAACGTQADPVYQQHEEKETVEEAHSKDDTHKDDTHQEVTITEEVVPTELPPTATEIPTEVPTIEVVPTEAPVDVTEEAMNTDIGFVPVSLEEDPLAAFVVMANAENGEVLFNQNFDTPSGTWMCATCHHVDTEDKKIGPGLYGIPQRANLRVEGQGAYTYIVNSIKHSQDYIVDGYGPESVMPYYEEVLSSSQIYDLVAYVMTLNKAE